MMPTKEDMNESAHMLSKIGSDETDAVAAMLRAIADGKLAVVPATPIGYAYPHHIEALRSPNLTNMCVFREQSAQMVPVYAAAPNEIPEGT